MKKTSQGSNNSRPGVRSAYTPTSTYRTSAPIRTSGGSSRKPIKRKKKGAGAKVAIAIVAIIAVIGGGVALLLNTDIGKSALNKATGVEEKLTLTKADGTTVELTETELREQLAASVFPGGIVVDGTDVGGMTLEEASAALKASAPAQPIVANISLDLDGEVMPLDLSSLTFESNVDELLNEAYSQYALKGDEDVNALIANYNSREALKTTPLTYTSAYTLSTEGISDIVHGMLDDLSSEAKEAEIIGFNTETLKFEYKESSKGYVIDIDKAAGDVKALLDSSVYEGVIVVDAEVTEPKLTSDIIENEFGKISSSSSQTSANSNRNHNIQITCEKINGMVIADGEEFSFNGFIGQRTPDKGYMLAGTIQDGQLKDDYGGGICQVTSMIYQSVIKSNLEVLERHEHMWPSSYAVAGTDAAVDWPAQDFAFKNNSGYPIAICIYWNPENSYITAEIYGHLLPDGQTIGFEGSVTGRTTAKTDYIADASMPVGQRESVKGAHDGVTASSVQIWYDANGNEIDRVELPTSHYYAINAQVKVGILNPDGSLASLNPDGTVVGGEATESSSDSSESSETEATDPTDATTPSETGTTPGESTEATTPSETEATTAPSETEATTPPETQATTPPETEATTPPETAAPETQAPETQAPEAPAPEA